MGGMTFPNDKGQSGTASPDPVLVTIAPATSRNKTAGTSERE